MTDVEASGWLGLLLGTFCLIQGIRFRSGISRRMLAENYRDTKLSKWRRNGPFALIPLSLVFVLIGLAAIKGTTLPLGLVFVLIAAALACGPIALAIMASPPDWSKPVWLRQAEAADWHGYQPESRRGDVIFSAILAIVSFGAIAVIVVANFSLADLVGPLLLGIGTTLAFWGGRRRGRRGSS